MRVKHQKRTVSLSDEAYERLDKIIERNLGFSMSQIISYAIMQLREDIILKVSEAANFVTNKIYVCYTILTEMNDSLIDTNVL